MNETGLLCLPCRRFQPTVSEGDENKIPLWVLTPNVRSGLKPTEETASPSYYNPSVKTDGKGEESETI